MRKLADKITLTGLLVMLLGATGADSPGDKYLWAGAVVLAGCGMMALGQWLESKKTDSGRIRRENQWTSRC